MNMSNELIICTQLKVIKARTNEADTTEGYKISFETIK